MFYGFTKRNRQEHFNDTSGHGTEKFPNNYRVVYEVQGNLGYSQRISRPPVVETTIGYSAGSLPAKSKDIILLCLVLIVRTLHHGAVSFVCIQRENCASN